MDAPTATINRRPGQSAMAWELSGETAPVHLRIHQLLKTRGTADRPYPLQRLSADTGIPYSCLHVHAHGRSKRVDWETLVKLKAALACSWDELIGMGDSREAASRNPESLVKGG